MSSQERKTASRANGARSKGPITPAGKSRSSKNATRHGLFAKCVVLDCESREDFDSLLGDFVARFRPADDVELGLVEEMLSAFWRQRRIWAIETRIMDDAISTQPPDNDDMSRLTDAFTAVAAQPNLGLIHRYETRLHRIFQRALANLIQMRSLKELNPPESSKLRDEPRSMAEPLREPEAEPGEMGPEPAEEPAPLAENSKLRHEPRSMAEPLRPPEAEPGEMGPEPAAKPAPPAKDSKLRDKPRSISRHLAAPDPEGSEIGPEPAAEAPESRLLYSLFLLPG
jgi:hypothetical protein